jgi:hypothetical protein
MKRVMRKRPSYIRGLKHLVNYCGINEIVMVEIGSYAGESTSIFMSTGKIKQLTAVDPWQNGYDDRDAASYAIDMSKVEKMFDARVSPFDNVKKFKMTGDEAVKRFEDASLDLVYIDGCHTYEAVKNDIQKWLPKIKESGFIAGHDWGFKAIKKAIEEELGSPDKVFSDSSWVFKISSLDLHG